MTAIIVNLSSVLKRLLATVMSMNAALDKEREQLKELQNNLKPVVGNFTYYDCFNEKGSPFYSESWEDEEEEYRSKEIFLTIKAGKVSYTNIWNGERDETHTYEIEGLSLEYIDEMLKELPNFLERYEAWMQADLKVHTAQLDSLSKVVAAVKACQ